jgi:hypothetical protein
MTWSTALGLRGSTLASLEAADRRCGSGGLGDLLER